MKAKVSVIIPAYNEEKAVSITVEAMKELPEIGEIIVIDDGSRDNTEEKAKKAGAFVYKHKSNKGKGDALKSGVKLANYQVLAFIDADLKESASYVKHLITPVLKGDADMTIAVLPKAKKCGFGLVKKMSGLYIKYQTGFSLSEPLSGQRSLRKEVWDNINLRENTGFGIEVALSLSSIRKGYRVMEVPLPFFHRERGKDITSFIHRGRQFGAVTKVILGDLVNEH